MSRIVDDAGVLTPVERERLAATATWSEAELIVHLVPSVVKRAFRQHAVAVRRQLSERYERSVIVVVAVADRHIEIATARSYAEHFDAATCNALLLQHAVPAMREGRIADAIAATLEELARQLTNLPTPRPLPSPDPERNRSLPGWLLFLILFAMLLALATQCVGHPRGDGVSGASDSSWSWDSGGSDSGGSDSGSSDSGGSDGGGGADY